MITWNISEIIIIQTCNQNSFFYSSGINIAVHIQIVCYSPTCVSHQPNVSWPLDSMPWWGLQQLWVEWLEWLVSLWVERKNFDLYRVDRNDCVVLTKKKREKKDDDDYDDYIRMAVVIFQCYVNFFYCSFNDYLFNSFKTKYLCMRMDSVIAKMHIGI